VTAVETLLPLPPEPIELRANARALLDEAPDKTLRALADGGWLAPLLWEEWGALLEPRGWRRAAFQQVVASYHNELRLWLVGERPWAHCVSGLAGRVLRRQSASASR
jgi:alkylation response protein AidB-like acyl-CoA dehydrogenase